MEYNLNFIRDSRKLHRIFVSGNYIMVPNIGTSVRLLSAKFKVIDVIYLYSANRIDVDIILE
jgi:hypothetical protein